MSTPILPFSVWLSGTNQNSVPANDNSLRNQILNGLVISSVTTAQPVSPADGDIYIIPDSATGSQWSLFEADDLTIYREGTWYAFAPTDGVVVNIDGGQLQFLGSEGYQPLTGGGGSVSSVNGQTGTVVITSTDVVSAVVTSAATTYTLLAADAGKYRRLTATTAKTVTVGPESGEALPANGEWHFDNDGAGSCTFTAGAGVTIKAPYLGTLVVPQNGTVTLKRLASNVFRLLGATVAA